MMASEMFIPPLGTPQSPRNPPVLPTTGNATPPAWATNPATPGQYPPSAIMFNSPMPAGTPYIPHYTTPAASTYSALPGGTPYSSAPVLPHGYAVDYSGYPNFAPTPSFGTVPLGRPQGGHGAWPHQQPSPWQAAGAFQTGTPWHPMTAPLPNGPLPPQMGGGMHHPQAWGAPPMGAPPMLHPGGFPPQMMGGGGAWPGMGGPGMGGGAWDMGGMAAALDPTPAPLARAVGVQGDRMDLIDEFSAGPHYGAVLEPFLTHVLGVVPKLNPLIRPAPMEPGDAEHDYLKWNMLWASNMVQRSSDNTQTSWSNGRKNPATFPRITSMRLLPNILPFTIDVFARDPDVGITCGDLIDAISDSMRKHAGQADFDSLSASRKKTVSEAYRHNRSRAHGVPGGALGEGLRRLDFLGTDTMFGGVRADTDAVRRVCGELLPCTWILDCTTRYPMTREEIAAHNAREEALRLEAETREHGRMEEERRREEEREARRRSRRSSRAPSVMTVTDDDDDRSTVTGGR